MGDMATCDLPELVTSFRRSAKKALADNDFIRGMVFNIVAARLQACHERIEELEMTMERLHIDVESEVEITRSL